MTDGSRWASGSWGCSRTHSVGTSCPPSSTQSEAGVDTWLAKGAAAQRANGTSRAHTANRAVGIPYTVVSRGLMIPLHSGRPKTRFSGKLSG